MNENDNFESLRRLLALKQREVPPPGYFENFSAQVISRIRAGGHKSSENLFRESWLSKFMQMFEAKPAFASAFAGALCVLLLFGIVYAERSDEAPQAILQSAQLSSQSLAPASGAMADASPVAAPARNIFASSISNSSPSSLQPLFGGQNTFAEPVNFTVPGN